MEPTPSNETPASGVINSDGPLGIEEVLQNLPRKTGPLGGDLDSKQNPQCRRSPLKVSESETGLTLHRFTDTAAPGIKNEQAWHRMAAYMLLAKRTNSEIAVAAQVSVGQVAHLRAQRWFQELLATLANEDGEALVALVHGEAQASFNAMVDLRDDPDAPKTLRFRAAQTLFEYANGKATQKVISVHGHTTLSAKDEEEMLREELSNLASNVPAVKTLLETKQNQPQ